MAIHYFPVVLFTMLYKVVLTTESVNEILKCDHSVLSIGTVYNATQGLTKCNDFITKCDRYYKVIKCSDYYKVQQNDALQSGYKF